MTDGPICAATYEEGVAECDGEPGGERPCAWRTMCCALRDFFRLTSLSRDKTLAGMSKEDMEALARRISEARFSAGEVDSARKIVSEVLKKTARAKPKKARRYTDNVWALHLHFEAQLRDRFGKNRVLNSLHAAGRPTVVVCRPGSFYPVDRTEKSGYVTWYCKGEGLHDTPLFSLRFRPRLGAVHIYLPLRIEQVAKRFSEATMRKLHVVEVSGEPFKTLCRGLREEEIGIAISVMRKLVETGDYEIPGGLW